VRVSDISLVGIMGNQHVEGEIGDDLLRVAVFVFQFIETFRLGGGHPTGLLASQQKPVASVITMALTTFASFLLWPSKPSAWRSFPMTSSG